MSPNTKQLECAFCPKRLRAADLEAATAIYRRHLRNCTGMTATLVQMEVAGHPPRTKEQAIEESCAFALKPLEARP